MNIMSVRETVKQMHKARIISDFAFQKLIYAPVFVYDREDMSFTSDEMAWMNENIIDKGHDQIIPAKFPYPFFMLWHPATKERNATLFLVLQGEQGIRFEGVMRKAILTVFSHDRYKSERDGKERDCVLSCSYTGNRKMGSILTAWTDWKLNTNIERMETADLKFMASHTLALLARFSVDVMSKTHSVIKAMPKSEGRSVEWQLSRTHYVILSKKAAMKARDSKKAITMHDLKRAAHWRRAHFRVLKAECFTKKRGLRVPVCESWVGPEEWIGLDDKLYKVML